MLNPLKNPPKLISMIDVTAFLSIMVVLYFIVLFADSGPFLQPSAKRSPDFRYENDF